MRSRMKCTNRGSGPGYEGKLSSEGEISGRQLWKGLEGFSGLRGRLGREMQGRPAPSSMKRSMATT